MFRAEAVELARLGMNKRLGGPFGAVIVGKDGVIAEGQNQVTSDSDPTAHAEVVAIRRACTQLADYRLSGCTLYSSCEPCPMCLSAIYWSRCDRLVFAASRQDAAAIGFDDERLYKELQLPTVERGLPTLQLLREDAARMMSEWTTLTAKLDY